MLMLKKKKIPRNMFFQIKKKKWLPNTQIEPKSLATI